MSKGATKHAPNAASKGTAPHGTYKTRPKDQICDLQTAIFCKVAIKISSFSLRSFASVGIEFLHAVHYHAPGLFFPQVQMLGAIGAEAEHDASNC